MVVGFFGSGSNNLVRFVIFGPVGYMFCGLGYASFVRRFFHFVLRVGIVASYWFRVRSFFVYSGLVYGFRVPFWGGRIGVVVRVGCRSVFDRPGFLGVDRRNHRNTPHRQKAETRRGEGRTPRPRLGTILPSFNFLHSIALSILPPYRLFALPSCGGWFRAGEAGVGTGGGGGRVENLMATSEECRKGFRYNIPSKERLGGKKDKGWEAKVFHSERR